MAAPTESTFDGWLSEKLQNINPEVDLEVFVSYIRGILETDTSREDKVESISGIMGEIAEYELESHCDEILKRWDVLEGEDADKNTGKQSLEEQMHKIIENQQTTVVKTNNKATTSAEAKARKAAILAQYSQLSDGEGSDPEVESASASGGGGGGGLTVELIQNVNSLVVDQAAKESREKQKAESEKKKQKDKDDREKQKQKAQDRKDAEKKRTQKGERRTR